MKADRSIVDVLTLTGEALNDLDSYLQHGWRIACYSWGYAFIVRVKGGK